MLEVKLTLIRIRRRDPRGNVKPTIIDSVYGRGRDRKPQLQHITSARGPQNFSASIRRNKVTPPSMPVVCERYAKCGAFGFASNVYIEIFLLSQTIFHTVKRSHDKGNV